MLIFIRPILFRSRQYISSSFISPMELEHGYSKQIKEKLDICSDMFNTDVLVCGRCQKAFHILEEFQEHKKSPNCVEREFDLNYTPSNNEMWAFNLWRNSPYIQAKCAERSLKTLQLYNEWIKLTKVAKNKYMSAAKFYWNTSETAKKITASTVTGSSDENGQEISNYIVEAVVDKRFNENVVEYMIKWQGYSHEDNSWEPEDNLNNYREKIDNYEEILQRFLSHQEEIPSESKSKKNKTRTSLHKPVARIQNALQKLGINESNSYKSSSTPDGLSADSDIKIIRACNKRVYKETVSRNCCRTGVFRLDSLEQMKKKRLKLSKKSQEQIKIGLNLGHHRYLSGIKAIRKFKRVAVDSPLDSKELSEICATETEYVECL